MPGPTPLTDAEIAQLANDPTFTSSDVQKLSPQSRQKYLAAKGVDGAQPSQASRIKQGLDDLGTGFAKGAGETAVNLGKVVHALPVVGNMTDAIGGSDTVQRLIGAMTGNDVSQTAKVDPSVALSQSTDDMGLKSDNGMQTAGKIGEQLTEMLATADPVRKGVIEAGAHMIPNSASASTMGLLNKLNTIFGRTAGEGINAGANAMLHNDETPGRTAAIAAAGPLAGEGVAAAAPLLKNPNVQKVLALMAGITGMHAAGGLSDIGLGAGLGSYGLSRQLATQLMRRPIAVKTVQNVARRGLPKLADTIATLDSQARR